MASCEVARHGADLICISLNIHGLFLRSYSKHFVCWCVGVWGWGLVDGCACAGRRTTVWYLPPRTHRCVCVSVRVCVCVCIWFLWICFFGLLGPHQSHLHMSFHFVFLDFATVIGLNLAEMRPRSGWTCHLLDCVCVCACVGTWKNVCDHYQDVW
jgi:hypothetical protein